MLNNKGATVFRKALQELNEKGYAVIVCESGRYALRQKDGEVVKDGFTRQQIERFSTVSFSQEPVMH